MSSNVALVTRVMVVDDDTMVRQFLRQILTARGLDVVAEAADGDEVVTGVQAHHPDVVLMDLRMARTDGVRATAAVAALPDPPGVVAMTSFDTESAILDAVHAGAAGFLAKDSGPDELVAAVEAVAAGEGALSPRAARVVMDQVAATPTARGREEARAALARLTDREREIAHGVAEGLTNAEIAGRLYLGAATVKTHLGNACQKLGVNRVRLALLVDRAA
ncbi:MULTISPECIES: response regulator transcription factor [unclassified Isoptericola]|uniref:response regulator transcription factor n=1 Tax=unclassified Isoptericola TaxID=2623355 RepID=UPI002713E250|nr:MULTISPECIES: response regulator transcription factor [unclassified Isoptericola]MDO8143630.1 response regulator transcription factor [Isoptericola sp. 178]MDO8147528.1 response regulator transcription factor [Isoptericola sp. b515]MDO8150172.1 response regulator transcription factor [Isoptericola sp. b408]